MPALTWGARIRGVVAWAGIVLILASAVLYSESTVFPGIAAAVPVVGTMAVIHARSQGGRLSPMAVGAASGVQRLGDASYSVYLWHWPVIIFLPWAVEIADDAVRIMVMLAATAALSAFSYVVLEQPFRRSPRIRGARPGVVVAVGLAGSALVLATGAALWQHGEASAREQQALVESLVAEGACIGAVVGSGVGADCGGTAELDAVVPAPSGAAADKVHTCMQGQDDGEVLTCLSGVELDQATRVVAVVGDSHAAHFLPAVRAIAESRSWAVVEITKGSCPFTTATREAREGIRDSCVTWNVGVVEALEQYPDVDAVFTSASSINGLSSAEPASDAARELALDHQAAAPSSRNTSAEGFASAVDGYVAAWGTLPDSVEDVYVLRDVHRPREDVVECLDLLTADQLWAGGAECGLPRDEAVVADPLVAAAEAFGARARVIDVTDAMCDATSCLPVDGGVLVFRDPHHLTQTYATSLAPLIAAQL